MTWAYDFVYPNGDSIRFEGVDECDLYADGSVALCTADKKKKVVVAPGYRYYEIEAEGQP